MEKPYSVTYWGSNPEDDNDDCWTGKDFDTLEEAMTAFNAAPHEVIPDVVGRLSLSLDSAYIMLDGPGINGVRKNPLYNRKVACDDGEWSREIGMQAGMAFGCQGYNEAMGYD